MDFQELVDKALGKDLVVVTGYDRRNGCKHSVICTMDTSEGGHTVLEPLGIWNIK